MGKMPFIAEFEPDPHQIRSDASRAEKVRNVIDVFARLRHRAPASRLASDRAYVLGMAIPTALAQIHVTTALLQRRVRGGPGQHPFELAEIGTDDGGHSSRARGGPENWQEALGYDGQEEKADTRHQGDEPCAHQAAPPAGIGAAPKAGSAARAGRASA